MLHGLDVAAVLVAGQVLRAPVGPAPRGDGLVAIQVADDRDRADGVEVDFLRGRDTGASVPVHAELCFAGAHDQDVGTNDAGYAGLTMLCHTTFSSPRRPEQM